MSFYLMRAVARLANALPQSLRDSLYRLGPISKAIRSVLTSAAPDGIHPEEIASGPLAGLRLELDLRAEKALWLGTYEPALLRAIDHFAGRGETAYDVGANIGYVSLALAMAVGQSGRVVAFEPLPDNLSRLKANLALNPIGARVKVVGAAVGASASREAFLVHDSGAMGKLQSSQGRETGYGEPLEVEVTTLDDWAEESSPGLIKIDVEGGEAAVLEGARGVLSDHRPIVLLELHGPEASVAAIRKLESAGYSLHAMRSGYPELGELKDWKTYAVALPPEGTAEP